ncbi:CerR family C-terminal domain-containing protein [Francisella sciaenopsi]|uniref:DNA-binding transcriptional regulator CecR n=1 Tax=Francisella sciaenopsi TaxID=3055034 RepID=A0ABQ6PEQ1_9GAMM
MSEKTNKTKQALLLAGLKLFGEYGVVSTSTRMLANEANANISSIKYHFESKEGLYQAVIKYIVSKIMSDNKEAMSSIMLEINNPKLSKQKAREIYKQLSLNVAKTLIGNEESRDWAKIIIREQASPTSAFDIMYEGQMKPLLNTALKLSSVIYDCQIDNKLVIRQQIVLGQILGFVVARESFKRMSNINNLSDIKDEILQQVSICIDAVVNTPLEN